MARLTEGCEVFLASLEKAQAELIFVGNRLEEEFSSRYEGGEINPLGLLSRIHRLSADLPEVAAECSEVLQAKQEFVDAAKRQLVGNTEILRRLQRKAGTNVGEGSDEALRAFQDAVHELEAKLRLQHVDGGKENLNRSELNRAKAHSVIS